MKRIFFSLFVCLACVSTSMAAECCHQCERCGCAAECCKICRCVPDIKKVTKTTYSCECEDFCVPGPSDHCITYDECGHKQHVYTPGCATMRTRKKLVKHDTTTEVKTYKWVVESLCQRCAANEQAESSPANVALAPAAGAEGMQMGYEPVADILRRADETAAAPQPAGDGTKSVFRRLLNPVLGR